MPWWAFVCLMAPSLVHSAEGDHMHRTVRIVLVALAWSVVITGCGQDAAPGRDFTDRQIFEGVVFGSGSVASLLPEAREQLAPELYARNTDELAAMAEARASIIDAVERAEPGFLAEFGRAARSGNPASVRAMLVRTVYAVSQTVLTSSRPRG